MSAARGYRDRVYIIKDIILTLGEYGELNQTSLLSYCGLNLTKHRNILEDLESHEMISREERIVGKRTITIYKATSKGLEFCRTMLEPYENLFPRKKQDDDSQPKKLGLLIFV
jgi:predicted transcriptional regulator